MPPGRPAGTSQHTLIQCRYLLVAFRLATQCMGPVQVDDGATDDAKEILSSMPALSLSSPWAWSCGRRCAPIGDWRCSHKFDPKPSPTHWNHFLRLWINTLEPWIEHHTPTLPHTEVKRLLHGLDQLDGPDGLLDHPRANQPGSPPPPPDTPLPSTQEVT